MRTNTVKENLKQGKLQLGAGFGQLRSPEIPKLLAAAGFHWAFLDTEHGGFDLRSSSAELAEQRVKGNHRDRLP